jgi:hypothetical protein
MTASTTEDRHSTSNEIVGERALPPGCRHSDRFTGQNGEMTGGKDVGKLRGSEAEGLASVSALRPGRDLPMLAL